MKITQEQRIQARFDIYERSIERRRQEETLFELNFSHEFIHASDEDRIEFLMQRDFCLVQAERIVNELRLERIMVAKRKRIAGRRDGTRPCNEEIWSKWEDRSLKRMLSEAPSKKASRL